MKMHDNTAESTFHWVKMPLERRHRRWPDSDQNTQPFKALVVQNEDWKVVSTASDGRRTSG
jgi:hypothetical protein